MDTKDTSFEYECRLAGRAEWDAILQKFDDASLYQTWSYGAIRWGPGALRHVLLKRQGEVVAAAQVRVLRFPFSLGGVAYVPWGPVWRRKGKEEQPEHLREMLRALRRQFCDQQRLLLRVNPCEPDVSPSIARATLEQEGFRRNASAPAYRTLLLDLSPTLEQLRRNLEQKWRNQLNRAEKNDLEVVEGTGNQLYEVFLQLAQDMLSRKGFVPGVDYREFGRIQNDLPEPLKMRILICKERGEPVSALVVSGLGNTGIYLLGATSTAGHQSRGSYLLQWRMIQWLKSQGYRWYDLGGINPEENPGVYHFKVGLAGKSALDIRHIGQFEAQGSWVSDLTVNSLEAGRRGVRSLRKGVARVHQRLRARRENA